MTKNVILAKKVVNSPTGLLMEFEPAVYEDLVEAKKFEVTDSCSIVYHEEKPNFWIGTVLVERCDAWYEVTFTEVKYWERNK